VNSPEEKPLKSTIVQCCHAAPCVSDKSQANTRWNFFLVKIKDIIDLDVYFGHSFLTFDKEKSTLKVRFPKVFNLDFIMQ
jgi:hypothetical protein